MGHCMLWALGQPPQRKALQLVAPRWPTSLAKIAVMEDRAEAADQQSQAAPSVALVTPAVAVGHSAEAARWQIEAVNEGRPQECYVAALVLLETACLG